MGRPVKEHSLTKQDIVKAAIVCLEKEGEFALGVNRVARSLGIKPPSIYKHLDGNPALRRAVALEIWQRFFALCHQQTTELNEPLAMLQVVGHTARNFARSHPSLYAVMIQVQLQPSDPDFAAIVQTILNFYERALKPYDLTRDEMIDAIRMLHAAFYGFVAADMSGLLTLERSTDASYEVIIHALVAAISHIRQPRGK
ncbi:TetR/AcrR family transcriptional regulator [Pelatocladus sp. BLCC-F211]|uniref:TetR/AcrR family transcriptional regulator n=1 Tax=Pelatocladus sp. BLCC-F211 TaxID=3342752 RepID=UPI0035B9B0F5